MKQSEFYDKIYALLKTVPKGKITTYADLAHAAGCRAYRAVGTAMNKNPHAPVVPCHRVVNSDGRLGGYNDHVSVKIKRLKQEGIDIKDGKVVDFRLHRHLF